MNLLKLCLLPGLVIGQFTSDLWEYSFVHTWGRPDSVSETEFTEERKIFRKSINFKRAGFNELKKEISAELENIGALSTILRKAVKAGRLFWIYLKWTVHYIKR